MYIDVDALIYRLYSTWLTPITCSVNDSRNMGKNTIDNNEGLQATARTICKAICKENFRAIQQNLSAQTVWIEFPVTSWTVLHHLAASQFLSIDNWKYVLNIGAQADRQGFIDRKTALGETVFDVFFRTRLDPVRSSRAAWRLSSATL